MTARENILTGFHNRMRTGMFDALVYWGRSRAEEEAFAAEAKAIIEFLELEELRHAVVGDLSCCLRKRVDLGRAIALNPKIFIMDGACPTGAALAHTPSRSRRVPPVTRAMAFGVISSIREHPRGIASPVPLSNTC